MKNKFLKVLLAVFAFAFCLTGCKLFDNDFEVYTEEDLFKMYKGATDRVNYQSNFTSKSVKTTSYGDTQEVSTYSLTRDDDEMYINFVDENGECSKISIIKQEGNQYLKYNDENGSKKTSYIVVNDFEKEYPNVSVDDTIFGASSIYDIKQISFETLKDGLSLENSDFVTIDDTFFEIVRNDKKNVLTVISSGIVKNSDNKFIRVSITQKVYFEDTSEKHIYEGYELVINKITKYTSKLMMVEVNSNNEIVEGGSSVSIETVVDVSYSFDSTLKISDFSDYPLAN